jgi:hypothetical protein
LREYSAEQERLELDQKLARHARAFHRTGRVPQ